MRARKAPYELENEYADFLLRGLRPECQDCLTISQDAVQLAGSIVETCVTLDWRGRVKDIDRNKESEELKARQQELIELGQACTGPMFVERPPYEHVTILRIAGYPPDTALADVPEHLFKYMSPLQRACSLPLTDAEPEAPYTDIE